jgi:hypothetical protein
MQHLLLSRGQPGAVRRLAMRRDAAPAPGVRRAQRRYELTPPAAFHHIAPSASAAGGRHPVSRVELGQHHDRDGGKACVRPFDEWQRATLAQIELRNNRIRL